MRAWLNLVLWIGLAGMLFALPACATRRPPPTPPPRNLATEVLDTLQRSVAAWNAGNLDRFMAVYGEDATLALRDGFLQGYQAIRAYYAPQFAPAAERIGLALEDLHVEVLSLDVVLVWGKYRNTDRGGVIGEGTTSLVLRYELGQWRIFHDHST